MGRRDFGSIRRRNSGRWQARYRDPSGRLHARTFGTRSEAARYLAGVRADLNRGEWFDPTAGRPTLGEYSAQWLTARRVRGRPLAPRTTALYRWLLDKHVPPTLRNLQLRQLSPSVIRDWHAHLTSSAGPGAIAAAKCYRLLRTICNSAVSEHEIARNPCTIPGAGQESSPERPTATLPQVLALADEVGEIWRALVILAAFCSLRIGELAALTRSDIDPIHGTVTVRASASDAGGIRQGTTNDQPSTNTGRVQTGWSGQLGLLPRLRGADPDVPEGHPRASPSLDLTCAPTPHDLGACVARIVSPSAVPSGSSPEPTDDKP